MATQEMTVQYLSFEWSHDQMFPTDLKAKALSFIAINSTQETDAHYLAG